MGRPLAKRCGMENKIIEMRKVIFIDGVKYYARRASDKDYSYVGDLSEVKQIMFVVAEVFKTTPDALIETFRTEHISMARHTAMYLLHKNTNLNLMEIGEYFNRVHTSVIKAEYKIKSYLSFENKFTPYIKESILLTSKFKRIA